MSFFSKLVVLSLPLVPKSVVGYFSKRYIAGSTIKDVVKEVKRLNSEGMCATIDVLGESIKHIDQAKKPLGEYLQTLETIANENLDANISIKPTQLGLMLDYKKCLENFSKIIESAKAKDNFVRIDMEDAPTTDATLRLYAQL
ncbi:MAG: proline dehydrogenase family protein, partial [Candidatus Marinimicrobia bacterium]|nr:proline dehydrogenase family protein [Candidatus Neomarinimicrobiota bacterium]